MQPAGVLDGEDVGGRHHLAQPRAHVAGLPEGRAAEHQPSVHDGARSLSRPGLRAGSGPHTLAAWRCWLPSGRTQALGSPRRPAGPAAGRSPARGATAPRRCRDDGRLSWLLTAALGVATPGQPALGHQLPARPAVRRGLLPARGARAADLGFRVQPRLLVHRPPAAGQVADRGRRAVVRLQLLRLAVPVRGGRRRRGRRPRPAGPAADRLDAARPARRAAARARRLLLHPRRGSACSTSSCRCSWSAAVACLVVDRDSGARADPARWTAVATAPARPARLADRRRRPVRLRLRGEVERRLVPRVLRRPLAVLGPRGLAGGRGAAARPGRRCAAGCPGAVVGAGRRPGAHLPGDASPAGSSARPRRARRGRSSTPTPRSRSSPTRCARCGTSTPSG